MKKITDLSFPFFNLYMTYPGCQEKKNRASTNLSAWIEDNSLLVILCAGNVIEALFSLLLAASHDQAFAVHNTRVRTKTCLYLIT